MKVGRPPTLREAINAALAGCDLPIGATHAWLVAATGIEHSLLKATLYKMVREGSIFASPRFKNSTYFLSAEARDIGAPLAEAHFCAIADAIHAAAAERLKARDRVRSRLRTQRAAALRPPKLPKPPKPPKEPKAPKEPKVAKPKREQKPQHKPKTINPSGYAAVVHVPKAKPASWKDQPAIVPPHVRVQKLPGCPVRSRYEPPKWFKGEFVREFEELTSANA